MHIAGKVAGLEANIIEAKMVPSKSNEETKNPISAICAFLKAFLIQEDAEHKYQMILISHSGSAEQLYVLQKSAQGDQRVLFINGILTDEDNVALHKYLD
eukprot:5210433-Ditylum_brightwellii.AAC.1